MLAVSAHDGRRPSCFCASPTRPRSLALNRSSGSTRVVAAVDAENGSQLRASSSWQWAIRLASGNSSFQISLWRCPAARGGSAVETYSGLVAARVQATRTASNEPVAPTPGPAPAPTAAGVPTTGGGGSSGSSGGSSGGTGGGAGSGWRRDGHSESSLTVEPGRLELDADERDAHLAGLDGQRRGDRVSIVPRFDGCRQRLAAQLYVLGTLVRHELRTRRRGARCRVERLSSIRSHCGHGLVPAALADARHDSAVRSAGDVFLCPDADVGQSCLARVDGQRRSGRLSPLSRWSPRRLHAAPALHLLGADVRDQLQLCPRGRTMPPATCPTGTPLLV